MEAIIFMVFVVVQATFSRLPTTFESLKDTKFAAFCQRHHWIVWFAHPVVLSGTKEYVIHIIVYSGHIIGGH